MRNGWKPVTLRFCRPSSDTQMDVPLCLDFSSISHRVICSNIKHFTKTIALKNPTNLSIAVFMFWPRLGFLGGKIYHPVWPSCRGQIRKWLIVKLFCVKSSSACENTVSDVRSRKSTPIFLSLRTRFHIGDAPFDASFTECFSTFLEQEFD